MSVSQYAFKRVLNTIRESIEITEEVTLPELLPGRVMKIDYLDGRVGIAVGTPVGNIVFIGIFSNTAGDTKTQHNSGFPYVLLTLEAPEVLKPLILSERGDIDDFTFNRCFGSNTGSNNIGFYLEDFVKAWGGGACAADTAQKKKTPE